MVWIQRVTTICLHHDKLLLQQEYSYPPNKILYQFPGGKVEPGELPVNAAKRELIEESGLITKDIQEIGWYYTNNRRSNAKMHVMLAKEFKKDSTLLGDIEENIISAWIPASDLKQMICDGKIVNFSVLAAWAIYSNKRI